tara:strand:+ start:5871 stop:6914 length:1044 start_codon:yes stop_codon:yes gene_type:complete
VNKYLNNFLKSYAYFHQKITCVGFPKVSNIELTNRCAMDCKMCPRGSMKRPVGLMDFKLFKKIVDQIPLYANQILCIHGIGDSLLHPDLNKFITYANKKGFKTTTSTNPSSLNPKTIETILESGLGHLTISLDGVDSDTYRFIRGDAADYEKALKNIHNFLEEKQKGRYSKPEIEMSIIKMDKTEYSLEEFYQIWNLEGIDRVTAKDFISWDGSQQNIINMNKNVVPNNGRPDAGKFACIRPWLTISVLWDGRVVSCCYDYDGKFLLGDLNTQTIEDIWNGEKAKMLRKSLIEKDFSTNKLCEKCREVKGAKPSRIYPLNMFKMVKQFGVKKILKFIRQEGNVFIDG